MFKMRPFPAVRITERAGNASAFLQLLVALSCCSLSAGTKLLLTGRQLGKDLLLPPQLKSVLSLPSERVSLTIN